MPDFDRYFQEQEAQTLLEEMAGHSHANIFRISIYQSLRAPGPRHRSDRAGRGGQLCAEQIASAADEGVAGVFQQEELWPATLPLGRDSAARAQST